MTWISPPVRKFWITFLGINALLAVTVWILLNQYTAHGDYRTIPDLKGLTLSQARSKLQEMGLHAKTIDSNYAEGMDPGAVLATDPETGSQVKEGRTVYLTVNLTDLPLVPLPDLTDLSLRKATLDLQNKGFRVGNLIRQPDLAHNVVLGGQRLGLPVRAGMELPRGSVVDLVIGYNNSDSLVEIPILTGLTLEEAKIFLAESALSLGTVHYLGTVGDTTTALVVRQRPMPGSNLSSVRALEFVDLWLAD